MPNLTMDEMIELYGEPISTYSILQSIEDGYHVDANQGDFKSVTNDLCPSTVNDKMVVAMTREVYELVKKAVDHPKWHNDYAGVWWDIGFMGGANKCGTRLQNDQLEWYGMKTIITGTGRKRLHQFKFTLEGVSETDNRIALIVSLVK